MKWRNRKQSQNVDDRRGQQTSSRGGVPSAGTILYLWPLIKPLLRSKFGMLIIAIGAIAYFGNFGGLISGNSSISVNQELDDERADFVKTVLADTEAVWADFYTQAGARYSPPVLVLYRGSTVSGCGMASARMGPFYCPADEKIYVDLGFFDDLETQHNAGGDFAQAYVLAHEVAHHVQNLEGTLKSVQAAKQKVAGKAGENALQVRVELQADCYAGLWANRAQQAFDMMEEGDLEEALTAAAAIGDDRLQKQSQGFSIPHTFTHGSSKQRVEWFSKGFRHGKLSACDTF